MKEGTAYRIVSFRAKPDSQPLGFISFQRKRKTLLFADTDLISFIWESSDDQKEKFEMSVSIVTCHLYTINHLPWNKLFCLIKHYEFSITFYQFKTSGHLASRYKIVFKFLLCKMMHPCVFFFPRLIFGMSG